MSVAGGTSPYTYSWSNGSTTEDLSGLAAGTYDVTVTDANNCTATTSATVNEPSALIILHSVQNVSCPGGDNGQVNLSVSGAFPPFAYLWSNGETTSYNIGLTAGNYCVSITDNKGCQETRCFNVSEPPATVITATIDHINCNGDLTGAIDITVSGGTPPYTYYWSNGVNVEDQQNLPAGIYCVAVVDAEGCNELECFIIDQPDELQATAGVTNITYPGGTGSIDLSVTGGIPPYLYLWSTADTTEDIGNLAAGTYSYTVIDQNGCILTGQETIVENIVICSQAPQIYSDVLGPSSVRLSWDSVNGAHHYQIRGRRVGSPNIVYLTVAHGAPNQRTFNFLTPNVCYEWQLMAFCNAEETIMSAWSTLDTFCLSCPKPDSIWTDPVLANAARLNWTLVTGAVGYQIRGRRVGGPWVERFVQGGNNNLFNAFGLQPGTTYEWKVRAWCGNGGTAPSVYSSLIQFTTLNTSRLQAEGKEQSSEWVRMYPNPTSEKVMLEIPGYFGKKETKIQLYNSEGILVKTISHNGQSKTELNVEELENGLYQITIFDGLNVSNEKLLILR